MGGKARVLAGSLGHPFPVSDRGESRSCMSSINVLCTRPTRCCGIIGRGCLLSDLDGGNAPGAVLWRRRSRGSPGSLPELLSKECGFMIMGGSWNGQGI